MKVFNLSLVYSILLFTSICTAQVGIGTINPEESSLLDINDPTGTKGLLIPRVALTATNDSSPIYPEPAESLLVYNTDHSGSSPFNVSPGYYYWDNTRWVALVTTEKWDLLGNSGTDQNTHFIGTIDAQGLTFRTYNQQRFRIANENQVHALGNGTASLPFYSWGNDSDTGMYRINNNLLGFSTSGVERLRLSASEAVINEGSHPFSFRVESDNQANMFVVNGTSNKIGIKTNSPQTELHIAGSAPTATLRIEALNTTNNTQNVAADPAPVYVNNDGDLTLQPPLIQTFMPLNNVNFLGGGLSITSVTGAGVTISLFDTTINLTQESLVHINYQFSVQITRSNGTDPIVDGASRLFRSYVSVNGSSDYIAVDTGTYTNNPDGTSTSGTYAAGYYYLSGNGYVQLPAGSHTINLSALGFGGGNSERSFDFRMRFGETSMENFQVVVHR